MRSDQDTQHGRGTATGPSAKGERRGDVRSTPSQAEGDRSTIDQDICEKDMTMQGASAATARAACDSGGPTAEDYEPGAAEPGRGRALGERRGGRPLRRVPSPGMRGTKKRPPPIGGRPV